MTIARLAGAAASVCAFPWLPASEWLDTCGQVGGGDPTSGGSPSQSHVRNPCYAIDAGVGITLYDSSAQGLRPRYGWSNSQEIVGAT